MLVSLHLRLSRSRCPATSVPRGRDAKGGCVPRLLRVPGNTIPGGVVRAPLSASLRAGPCLWLLSVAVCGLLGRECGGVGAGVRRGEVCLTPLGSAEVRGGEGLGIRPQVRLSVEEITRCRNAIPWAPWLPRPTPPRLGVRDRGAGRVGLWGRPASWFVATALSPYPHWVEALWGVSCEGADSIHGAPHPPLAYLLKAQFPLRKFGGYRHVSCSDWSQGGGCLKSRLLGGRLGAGVGGPMPLQK